MRAPSKDTSRKTIYLTVQSRDTRRRNGNDSNTTKSCGLEPSSRDEQNKATAAFQPQLPHSNHTPPRRETSGQSKGAHTHTHRDRQTHSDTNTRARETPPKKASEPKLHARRAQDIAHQYFLDETRDTKRSTPHHIQPCPLAKHTCGTSPYHVRVRYSTVSHFQSKSRPCHPAAASRSTSSSAATSFELWHAM